MGLMTITITYCVEIHSRIIGLLEASRQAAARSVNALMMAAYWDWLEYR